MSAEKNLTFEEVNAHLEKHLTAEKTQSLTAVAAPSICSVYVIVKPVLTLISQVPLIPQKWRDAIKLLIQTLDALCPGN